MAAELAPPSRWGHPLERGRRRPPGQNLDWLGTSSACFLVRNLWKWIGIWTWVLVLGLGLDMVLGVGAGLDLDLGLEQQPEEDRWWLNKCLSEDAILTASSKQNNFSVILRLQVLSIIHLAMLSCNLRRSVARSSNLKRIAGSLEDSQRNSSSHAKLQPEKERSEEQQPEQDRCVQSYSNWKWMHE